MRSPTLSELPPPPPGKTGWPWTEATPSTPERMPDGGPWPRISIVTPSYNQGQFIEETIRSVLLQGYPDLEYIIIDGGSSDASVEVILKYQDWLKFWVSEKDDGQSDALNKGFTYASGQLYAYLNSDDVYKSFALQRVVNTVIEKDINLTLPCLFAGSVQNICDDSIESVFENNNFGKIYQWVYGGVSLHQPGCFWTENLFSSCGPFEKKYKYVFDSYFFSLARIKNTKFFHVMGPIAQFRLHSESKTCQFQDGFDLEWFDVRRRILNKIGVGNRVIIKIDKKIDDWFQCNWNTVSHWANEAEPEARWPILWARVLKSPLSLFHRPLSAAVWREIKQRCSPSLGL